MERSIYKKLGADGAFTDFKHHSSSWRNSKHLRRKRERMKLDIEMLEKEYVEMIENESINKENALYCEHENAGDRE